MEHPFYEFKPNEEFLWFEFESVSSKKIVKKIVAFSPILSNPDFYNLSLVDAFSDGSYSDNSITNNDDLPMVMATVIRTILIFFEKNPEKKVYIEGSTPERTRLYRIIIAKEINKIRDLFHIFGICKGQIEIFKPNGDYKSFVISLKNSNFLLKLLYENDGGKN